MSLASYLELELEGIKLKMHAPSEHSATGHGLSRLIIKAVCINLNMVAMDRAREQHPYNMNVWNTGRLPPCVHTCNGYYVTYKYIYRYT